MLLGETPPQEPCRDAGAIAALLARIANSMTTLVTRGSLRLVMGWVYWIAGGCDAVVSRSLEKVPPAMCRVSTVSSIPDMMMIFGMGLYFMETR
jgi:hypothetical protein